MSTKNRVEFLVLRKKLDDEGKLEVVEEETAGILDEDCRDLLNIGDPARGTPPVSFYLHDDQKIATQLPGVGSVLQAWLSTPTDITPKLLFTNKDVHIGGDYYARVRIHYAPLERREKTDGQCGDCALFSHERGVELLLLETHTFVDGEKGYMNQAIIDAMAETHGRPTLTKDNVGYCPKCKGLVGEESPTCDGYEEK
jgi:hypothetical protein